MVRQQASGFHRPLGHMGVKATRPGGLNIDDIVIDEKDGLWITGQLIGNMAEGFGIGFYMPNLIGQEMYIEQAVNLPIAWLGPMKFAGVRETPHAQMVYDIGYYIAGAVVKPDRPRCERGQERRRLHGQAVFINHSISEVIGRAKTPFEVSYHRAMKPAAPKLCLVGLPGKIFPCFDPCQSDQDTADIKQDNFNGVAAHGSGSVSSGAQP